MRNSKPAPRVAFWQLRVGERRNLLLIGDLLVALVSLWISLYYWGTSERFMGFSLEFLNKRVPLWFYFLPLVWLFLMAELYDVHRAADWRQTVRGVAMAAASGLVLYLALYFYYVEPPRSLLPRLGVASFVITVSLMTLLWRRLYIWIFTAPQFMRRVLLVGAGKNGAMFLKVCQALPTPPFIVAGIIDDDHRKLGTDLEGVQVVGASEQIPELIAEHQVSEIIVAISGELEPCLFQVLMDIHETGVEIIQMPTAYEELLGRVPILALEANWILRSYLEESRVSGFYLLFKRLLDIFGGLVGIAIFLLVLPFVAAATIMDDGWPIFYSQVRSGRGGQPYRIIKFRTMRNDAEADGKPRWAREDDERATRVGRFLRKTHIDELPQFLNVLRGEMSLVGPRAERPELVDYFANNVPFYRARLLVKPGITGWAQVNYGYAATIDETRIKLEYDLYYIKSRSVITDLMIMLRTPPTVLGFRGR